MLWLATAFKFVKAVPLRWWLYLAGALAICFILWREHHAIHRAKTLAVEKGVAIAERDQARATIETMKVDAALNKETTYALAERLKAADDERAAHPLRLRCYVPPAATVPAEGGSAGGTDDAAAGRVDGSADLPTFDAAPGLSEFQRRCAVNAATLATLQEFEAKRSH